MYHFNHETKTTLISSLESKLSNIGFQKWKTNIAETIWRKLILFPLYNQDSINSGYTLIAVSRKKRVVEFTIRFPTEPESHSLTVPIDFSSVEWKFLVDDIIVFDNYFTQSEFFYDNVASVLAFVPFSNHKIVGPLKLIRFNTNGVSYGIFQNDELSFFYKNYIRSATLEEMQTQRLKNLFK